MDIFMEDVSLCLDTQSNRGLRVSCGSDGPGLEPVAEESAARLSVDVAALEKEVAPAAAPPLGAVAVGPLGGRGRGPQTSEGSPRALVKSSSVKLIGPTHTRLSGQRKTLDSAEAAELKRLKSVRFSTCSDSDTDDCGAADLLASGGSKKSLGRRSLTLEAGETWQKLSQFTGLKVGTGSAAGSAGGPGDENIIMPGVTGRTAIAVYRPGLFYCLVSYDKMIANQGFFFHTHLFATNFRR